MRGRRRSAKLQAWTLGVALAASSCNQVDVLIARKDPAAMNAGGDPVGGDVSVGGSSGAPESPGSGGASSNDGQGGYAAGAGGYTGTGGPGGSFGGTGGAGGRIETGGSGGVGGSGASGGAGGTTSSEGGSSGSAGISGGSGGAAGSSGGRGGSNLPACPAEKSPLPSFVQGPWPYVEVGNIVVDASFVYLKVSDCCGADALGLTLRVPLAGGAAEAVHTSARYHAGLAQDDDNLYLSSQEGLKIFAKATSTLSVRPGLVYDGLAVRGGEVYGIGAGGLDRVGPMDAVTVAAAPWSLAEIVVDGRGVYGTNRGSEGQILFYDPAAGAVRALVSGVGAGGDLAQDDEYLYWAVDDELRRTRKSDGATNLVARAPAIIGGVTTDSTHVYFTSRGQQCAKSPAGVGRSGGAVHRVRKPNGQLETRVLDQVAPGKIAVDDAFIYWVAGSNESATRTVQRAAR
jgi:hypothetical protein